MFKKLKLKIMGNYIEKFIAKLLLTFRTKNPKIWAIIAPILFVMQFGANAAINSVLSGIGITDVELPEKFLSIYWLVATFNLPISDGIIQNIMYVIALAIGSGQLTPFMGEKKQAKAIEASQKKIQELGTQKS